MAPGDPRGAGRVAPGWVRGRLSSDRWTGLYLTLIVVVAVLGLRLFWSVAEGLYEAELLTGLDPFVSEAFFAIRRPPLTRALWIATVLGGTRVMVSLTVLAAGLFALWGRPREAVVLGLASGSGALAVELLKDIVQRGRPLPAFALVRTPDSFAFPSGHSMGSFVFFMLTGLMVARLLRRPGRRAAVMIAAAGAILAVGVSRVYLGVHWMTDVLGSWALGVTWVGVAFGILLTWDRYGRLPEARPLLGRRVRIALTAVAIVAAALAVAAGALADPLLQRVAPVSLAGVPAAA